MTASAMTVPEFQDLVDRCGVDSGSWPTKLRRRAQTLLSDSSAARDVLKRAQDVARMARAAPVKAPAGLADRIVAKALSQGNGKADPSPRPAKRKAARR